jgi:hypothetical protein
MDMLNPYEPPQVTETDHLDRVAIKPSDSALVVTFILLMFPCAFIAAAITSLLTADVLKDRLAGIPPASIVGCSLTVGALTLGAVIFTFIQAIRRTQTTHSPDKSS